MRCVCVVLVCVSIAQHKLHLGSVLSGGVSLVARVRCLVRCGGEACTPDVATLHLYAGTTAATNRPLFVCDPVCRYYLE